MTAPIIKNTNTKLEKKLGGCNTIDMNNRSERECKCKRDARWSVQEISKGKAAAKMLPSLPGKVAAMQSSWGVCSVVKAYKGLSRVAL